MHSNLKVAVVSARPFDHDEDRNNSLHYMTKDAGPYTTPGSEEFTHIFYSHVVIQMHCLNLYRIRYDVCRRVFGE